MGQDHSHRQQSSKYDVLMSISPTPAKWFVQTDRLTKGVAKIIAMGISRKDDNQMYYEIKDKRKSISSRNRDAIFSKSINEEMIDTYYQNKIMDKKAEKHMERMAAKEAFEKGR